MRALHLDQVMHQRQLDALEIESIRAGILDEVRTWHQRQLDALEIER